jgi:hypothetical protein
MPTVISEERSESKITRSRKFPNIILIIDVAPEKGKNYIPYSDCKRIIAGKFTSVRQYQQYVRELRLNDFGLPVYPFHTYREYEGAIEFLGGSASLNSIKQQYRSKKAYQVYLEKERAKIKEEDKLKSNLRQKTDASIADICKFLLNNDMIDILKNISQHKNINLSDARTITDTLIEYYIK